MKKKQVGGAVLLALVMVLALAARIFALPNESIGKDCENCHYATAPEKPAGVIGVLQAMCIEESAAPSLDGEVDSVWEDATPAVIPVAGGWAGQNQVAMRSVYTGDEVFFLVQWHDSTLSDRIQPWVKTGEEGTVGTWKKAPAKAQRRNSPTDNGWFFDSMTTGEITGHHLRTEPTPGASFEDSFALMWGGRDTEAAVGNVTGFDEVGCATMCHVNPGTGY